MIPVRKPLRFEGLHVSLNCRFIAGPIDKTLWW